MKFLIKLNKSATETFQMFTEAHRGYVLFMTGVFEWRERTAWKIMKARLPESYDYRS